MKSSLVRTPRKDSLSTNTITITNVLVKKLLGNKYQVASQGDITEFATTEEIRTDVLNDPISEIEKGEKMDATKIKELLKIKYDLQSIQDIKQLALREEEGAFIRGVYSMLVYGRGNLVVKVLQLDKEEADKYHKSIEETHHSWCNDSCLGKYILKVFSKKMPDYDEKQGLLFIEFEWAWETLAHRIQNSNNISYLDEDRQKDIKTLINALVYLHRRGDTIARNFHGDLKSDNIFFVETPVEGHPEKILKIGDIEDTMGTLPYRDLSSISLIDLEHYPPEKKDDIMALKMILLELAYDFYLVEFCDELAKKDKKEFLDFLGMPAYQRKTVIAKAKGSQRYLNLIPLDEIMKLPSVSVDLLEYISKKQEGKKILEMTNKYKPEEVCQIICKENLTECRELWEKSIDSIDTLKEVLSHWLKSLKKYRCNKFNSKQELDAEITAFYNILRYLAEFGEIKQLDYIKEDIHRLLKGCLAEIHRKAREIFSPQEIKSLLSYQYPYTGEHSQKAFRNLEEALEYVSSKGAYLDEFLKMGSPWYMELSHPLVLIPDEPHGHPSIKKHIYNIHLKSETKCSELGQCVYILEKCGEESELKAHTELDNLIKFQHPNVVELKSIFTISEEKTAFSTEKMDGDLFLGKLTPLQEKMIMELSPWELVTNLIEKIFLTILWIHEKKFVHGDLWAYNLLFKRNEQNNYFFKICDFGNMVNFTEEEGAKDLKGFWEVIGEIIMKLKGVWNKPPTMTLITEKLDHYLQAYTHMDYQPIKLHILEAIKATKALLPENLMCHYTKEDLDSFNDSLAKDIKIILPSEQELKYLFFDFDQYLSWNRVIRKAGVLNFTLLGLKNCLQELGHESRMMKYFLKMGEVGIR